MKTRDYRDFIIQTSRIDQKTHHYQVRVSGLVPGGTPGSADSETRVYDPAAFERCTGYRALLEHADTGKIPQAQLEELGATLSDALLPGSVRRRFHESLRITRGRGQGLRLRLLIEPEELRVLPWEYLWLPTQADTGDPGPLGFLALHRDISIVRHEAIDQREPWIEPLKHLRILTVAVGEQGRRADDSDRLKQVVTAACPQERTVLVHTWLTDPRSRSLQSQLQDRLHVFQYFGHGVAGSGSKGILLRPGNGRAEERLSADRLATLLRNAGVQLAILGIDGPTEAGARPAWRSLAAKVVQAGIPAVVVHTYGVEDRNAQTLLEQLFQGLLSGATIDQAIANTRASIYQRDGREDLAWGQLALYLRVQDGIIFPRDEEVREALAQQPTISVATTQTFYGDVGEASIIGVQAGSIGGMAGPQPQVIPQVSPVAPRILVGRDKELAQATMYIGSGRKTYYYGAYGVGKTSLAAALFCKAIQGADAKDAYIWHKVCAATVTATLDAIALYFGDSSVAKTGEDPVAKVNALRLLLAKYPRVLIGLDEVENAAVARTLVDAVGGGSVILNGTRPVGLGPLAEEIQVAPLQAAQADNLFASLANLDWESVPTADRKQIRAICRKLGNLPLAIRMAASIHAEGEPLQDLWQRLQVAPTTIIPEHEEVSTIFEASYQRIKDSGSSLQMLRRLASFPALEASHTALREGENPESYFLAKDRLCALELVIPMRTDRLSLHPLLGLLAKRRLGQENEHVLQQEESWVRRWLLDYAERFRGDYGALASEHDNLLGLFDSLKHLQENEAIISLAGALYDYLRVRGYWQEALDRLADAESAARVLNQPLDEARILVYRSALLTLRGTYGEATQALDRADAIYRSRKDAVGRGQVWYRRGRIAALTGDLKLARKQLKQALRSMGNAAPIRDIAETHEQLAGILAEQGNPTAARTEYEQALTLSRAANDRESQATTLRALGQLTRHAGDYPTAQGYYEMAVNLAEELGDRRLEGLLQLELGYLHYFQGEYLPARDCIERAFSIFEELSYGLGTAQAAHGLGNVALALADLASAQERYEEAQALNQALDNQQGVLSNRYQLAVISHRRDHLEAAQAAYRDILNESRDMGLVGLEAACWHQLGRIALAQEEWEVAREAAQRALDLAEMAHLRLTEVSALALRGLLFVHDDQPEKAKKTLVQAKLAFEQLRAPEAAAVQQMLTQLSKAIQRHERDKLVTEAAGRGPHVTIEGKMRFSGRPWKTIRGIDVIVEASRPMRKADNRVRPSHPYRRIASGRCRVRNL